MNISLEMFIHEDIRSDVQFAQKVAEFAAATFSRSSLHL